ncbi:MAG TPA: beta-ketoacyl-[acyl-carrier-protein] synthase II, partial [Pseudomonas sp.]|nr:beta-ketoacyl-[acyl-carrier-protein] synthase II [Pseudomonas sp.]
VICALGSGKAEVARRLFAGDTSGMQPHTQPVAGRRLPVGAVRSALP